MPGGCCNSWASSPPCSKISGHKYNASDSEYLDSLGYDFLFELRFGKKKGTIYLLSPREPPSVPPEEGEAQSGRI